MPRRFRRKKKLSDGKKALKIVRNLKKSIETKRFDVFTGANLIDWSGSLSVPLNVPEQGLTDLERVGDKVNFTSVDSRFGVVAGDNDPKVQVRMIMLWDKKNTILTPGQILDNVGAIESIHSFYLFDRRNEWIKIFDITYTLSRNSKDIAQHNRKYRLMKATQFIGGTDTIGSGALKMLYISSVDPLDPDADKPNINGALRIRFTDL